MKKVKIFLLSLSIICWCSCNQSQDTQKNAVSECALPCTPLEEKIIQEKWDTCRKLLAILTNHREEIVGLIQQKKLFYADTMPTIEVGDGFFPFVYLDTTNCITSGNLMLLKPFLNASAYSLLETCFAKRFLHHIFYSYSSENRKLESIIFFNSICKHQACIHFFIYNLKNTTQPEYYRNVLDTHWIYYHGVHY